MTGYHDLPEATAEALDGMAGSIPAISARSTPTDSCGSPTARRTCSRLARKVRGAVGDRRGLQGDLPVRRAQLIVYGEAQPYCVALIGLDDEAITELGGRAWSGGKSFAEIAHDQEHGN